MAQDDDAKKSVSAGNTDNASGNADEALRIDDAEPAFTRRAVVGAVAAAVVVFAVGGIGVLSRTNSLLRPLGAADESDFLSLCLRCDRCRSACPHHAIVIASAEDGFVNMRTPKLDFHTGYCDFCGAKTDETARPLCVVNCPTEALHEIPWDSAVLGIATIDVNECIAYERVNGCKVCVDECPYDAVYLNDAGKPEVETSLCNGCGYCEFKCPSHTYRSYSGSANRGIYVQPLEA